MNQEVQKMKKSIRRIRGLFLALLLMGTAILLSDLPTQAAKLRGWVTVGSTRYYYNKSGKKVTGLKKIGKYQYFFRKSDGSMVKSRWVRINGKYYYFRKNGRMAKTRWIKYKNQKYYVNKEGVRVTRFATISKKNYYFTKKGILQQSTWVKRNGLYYRADEKGVLDMTEGYDTKDPTTATRIVYKSSTLTVDIRKNRNFNCTYWTARVKIKNSGQLCSALSYGTYGGTRETTSHAVSREGGIIGVNGSAFSYSSGKPGFDAVMIKNGKIYNKALGTSYSLMAVLYDGTMFTPKQGLSAEELVQAGVKDTYNFGPAIIINGVTQPIIDPYQDTVTYKDPRTAVGMVRPGEYVLLVADGREAQEGGSKGLNYYEMAQILQSFHCTYAYNLDGGGSSTLVYRGRVLNNPSDGSERACGDFLYFKE